MQNANIIVRKYKFQTIMASCQTIGKGNIAWNLLLYLQMQQYLLWVDTVLCNTEQGKGRIMESRIGKLYVHRRMLLLRNHKGRHKDGGIASRSVQQHIYNRTNPIGTCLDVLLGQKITFEHFLCHLLSDLNYVSQHTILNGLLALPFNISQAIHKPKLQDPNPINQTLMIHRYHFYLLISP